MDLIVRIRQAVDALSALHGWEWSFGDYEEFCREAEICVAEDVPTSQAALERLIWNIRADGPTVRIALDRQHPQCEEAWADLYGQITGWLYRNGYFPQDAATLDGFSPDLCAFEDVQRHLPSFNYRSRLATFVNRITERAAHQWLRAGAALKRGGRGVASASARRSPAEDFAPGAQDRRSWNICYLSEAINDGSPLSWDDIVPSAMAEPATIVEGYELVQTIERTVMALEHDPHFPMMRQLWRALLLEQTSISALARQWDLPTQTVFNVKARLARRVAPVLQRWHQG